MHTFRVSLWSFLFFFLLMYAGISIVILGLLTSELAFIIFGVIWGVITVYIFRKIIPIEMLVGALGGAFIGALGGALIGMLVGNAGNLMVGVVGGATFGALGAVALFLMLVAGFLKYLPFLRYLPTVVSEVFLAIAIIIGAVLGINGAREVYPKIFGTIGGMAIVGWIVGMIVGAWGIFEIKKYWRYRRRKCPHCQGYMKRLDEMSDDVYLESGQKTEEILNSVDYDVWKCPKCNYHSLVRHPGIFSSLKTCPSCKYRTVRVSRETLSEPTYTSTGSERITQECQHCNYQDEEIVMLPILTREERADWDFGGGSSSGGGASGNW